MTQPTLTQVIEWARSAAELLREGYGKQHEVDLKGRIDLVTEMDRRCEDYLVSQIRSHYPQHTIVAEESGLLEGHAEHCWYIDPLDGTTNYAHAVPFFCISIGYAVNDQMMLGVVIDPMRDECFSAQRGGGAWVNGKPMHVSTIDQMVSSLLVTGFPYDSWKSGRSNLENFAHFTHISQGVRRLGAAALDMCYVAAGRFEGYWEQTLKPWDLAAGSLIIAEAGGIATSLEGASDLLQPPCSLLAGNPTIHAQMLEEFRKLGSSS
jgi:myo-inositol-1(or 4)-monophosphatase